MPRYLISLIAALAVLSCGESFDDPDFPFSSGDFTIVTLAVEDQCLDGGLHPLFMPRGTDTPWEWPLDVRVHAPADLPRTYDIQLRPPFHEVRVRATQTAPERQSLVVEPNPSVQLDEDQFGDCAAELSGVVEVVLLGTNELEGVAELVLRNPHGDERCPAEMPQSCPVRLSFEGSRAGAP